MSGKFVKAFAMFYHKSSVMLNFENIATLHLQKCSFFSFIAVKKFFFSSLTHSLTHFYHIDKLKLNARILFMHTINYIAETLSHYYPFCCLFPVTHFLSIIFFSISFVTRSFMRAKILPALIFSRKKNL
jgi:hypothetical protein